MRYKTDYKQSIVKHKKSFSTQMICGELTFNVKVSASKPVKLLRQFLCFFISSSKCAQILHKLFDQSFAALLTHALSLTRAICVWQHNWRQIFQNPLDSCKKQVVNLLHRKHFPSSFKSWPGEDLNPLLE